MQAYQFTTQVTTDGKLPIPIRYTKSLSAGHTVQVLVLIPETHQPQEDEEVSLEEIVAQIQQLPPDPTNIEPATGSLAEYLAHTSLEQDPDFNVTLWNQEWDRLEAEMKAASLAHERAEGRL